MWQRLSSGLLVRSTVAGQVRVPAVALPPELAPAAQPVAVVDGLPGSEDQLWARPNERELGLTPSDLGFLAGEAAQIPFEPAMLAIARLAAADWHIPLDATAQLALAESFFDGAGVVDLLRAWVQAEPQRVVFSEQQFFVVQRLLIEYARDGAIDDGMTEAEHARLKRLIIGAATLVDENHALALDAWVADDYALSLDEQFAAGQALQAMARANDDEAEPGQCALIEEDALRTTVFRDRMDDVRTMFAGPREWFREAFASDSSLTSLAWETTPFMQRPFLEISSGQLVLISPRAITTWLADGFYYRLLDAAQRRNEAGQPQVSLEYTKFVGELLEDWGVELVRSVYSGNRPVGGGRVYGEQPFGDGQFTPDITIDLGLDLVLIEVRSGYLNRRLRVSGDVNEFHRDLDRVVLRKVAQLGNRIADLLAKRATIPDVDIDQVDRIWPILVTVDLVQLEPLHDLIHTHLPEVFSDPRVQSLLVCDPEDLELLMGMVEGGASITDILDRRQRGPYAKLELKRWVLEDSGSPGERRPQYALDRWERVTTAVRNVLQLTE